MSIKYKYIYIINSVYWYYKNNQCLSKIPALFTTHYKKESTKNSNLDKFYKTY